MALMVVTQDFITPGVAASLAGNPLTSIVAGGGADIDRADRGCQSGGVDRPRGGHRWPGRRRSERDALSGSSTTGDHGVTVAATGLVLGNRGSGIEICGAKPWSSTTARSAPGSMVYAPTANGHVQNFGLIRSGNSNAGSTFGVVVNGGNARVENFGTIPSSTQVGGGGQSGHHRDRGVGQPGREPRVDPRLCRVGQGQRAGRSPDNSRGVGGSGGSGRGP